MLATCWEAHRRNHAFVVPHTARIRIESTTVVAFVVTHNLQPQCNDPTHAAATAVCPIIVPQAETPVPMAAPTSPVSTPQNPWSAAAAAAPMQQRPPRANPARRLDLERPLNITIPNNANADSLAGSSHPSSGRYARSPSSSLLPSPSPSPAPAGSSNPHHQQHSSHRGRDDSPLYCKVRRPILRAL